MNNIHLRRYKSSIPFWSAFPQTGGRDPAVMKKFSFLDGELEEEHHSRIAEFVCTLSSKVHPDVIRRILAAISLCLSSIGTIKEFIRNIREILGADEGQLFTQLVQLMIYGDFPLRMCDYLREHGVNSFELPEDISNSQQTSVPDLLLRKVSKKKGTRRPPNKWTKEESQRLIELVEQFGDKRWKKISQIIGGGKSGAQCAQHWKRVLCPEIRKGSWDVDEEDTLFQLVAKHGQAWKKIAIEIKTRTDIQCRYQYLKACMSREERWGIEEDRLMAVKVLDYARQTQPIIWLEVTRHLMKAKRTKIPRTALECKTRWEQIHDRIDIQSLEKSMRESPPDVLRVRLDSAGLLIPLHPTPEHPPNSRALDTESISNGIHEEEESDCDYECVESQDTYHASHIAPAMLPTPITPITPLESPETASEGVEPGASCGKDSNDSEPHGTIRGDDLLKSQMYYSNCLSDLSIHL